MITPTTVSSGSGVHDALERYYSPASWLVHPHYLRVGLPVLDVGVFYALPAFVIPSRPVKLFAIKSSLNYLHYRLALRRVVYPVEELGLHSRRELERGRQRSVRRATGRTSSRTSSARRTTCWRIPEVSSPPSCTVVNFIGIIMFIFLTTSSICSVAFLNGSIETLAFPHRVLDPERRVGRVCPWVYRVPRDYLYYLLPLLLEQLVPLLRCYWHVPVLEHYLGDLGDVGGAERLLYLVLALPVALLGVLEDLLDLKNQ